MDTITVTLGKEKFTFDVAKTMSIDRHDLDEELAKQAATFAFFAMLHERFRSQVTEIEAILEEQESAAKLAIFERDEGVKIERLRAEVRNSVERKALLEKLRSAQTDERLLNSIVQALAQRKDCLIALARNRMLEMSSPPPVEVERVKANLLRR